MRVTIMFAVDQVAGGYVITGEDDKQVAVASSLRNLRARVGEYAADQVEVALSREKAAEVAAAGKAGGGL